MFIDVLDLCRTSILGSAEWISFQDGFWRLWRKKQHRAESRIGTWLNWLLSNTDVGSAGLVLPSPSSSSICTV
jgi:hypothetical protein